MELVPATIVAPSYPRAMVDRTRLDELAFDVGRSRLTTLFAPAGTGRSAALLQWTRHLQAAGRPILWLAVRGGIVDIDTFIAALKASGERSGLSWDQAATQDVAQWRSILVSETGKAPVIIIDDAHLLPDDVLSFVEQLIATSHDTTMIMSGRHRLNVSTSRLRSARCILEVDETDLWIDRTDALAIITRHVGHPVDADILNQAIELSGGWAAAIAMCAEYIRRHGTVDAPLESQLNRYFDDEVLAELSTTERTELLALSVLDKITPEACNALFDGACAGKVIRRLEDRHFLIAQPNMASAEYVVATPLLRALRVRSAEETPERSVALHRKCAEIFADSHPELAIEHAARTGDDEFLADMLDRLGEKLVYQGYLYRVSDLADTLAPHLIRKRPALALAQAWRRIRQLNFNAASRLIDAAQSEIETLIEQEACDKNQAYHLRLLVGHRRVMLLAAQDKMADVEREAVSLLSSLDDANVYLCCTLVAQIITARRELYHFHDILNLEAEIRRAVGRPEARFASISLMTSAAPTLVAQGRTDAARKLLVAAMDSAKYYQDRSRGLVALPAMPLAELSYDANDLDTARDLIDRHLDTVREWGFIDQLASGYLVQARLEAAAGNWSSALAGLDEAHLVAVECGVPRLRAFVVGEQVRILTRLGDVNRAAATFASGGYDYSKDPVPGVGTTRGLESVAVAWCRIAIQRHDLSRARKVVRRWLDFTRKQSAIRSTAVMELLLAEIEVIEGNRNESRRALRAALDLAAPANWIRLFLDEGEAITSLILDTYGDESLLGTATDRFARQIRGLVKGHADPSDFSTEEDVALTGRLGGREMEILALVSGGLRNREIGDRLGLTEGTVKWYMQQIYDKLGVRRRPQAVIRARQIGLMS